MLSGSTFASSINPKEINANVELSTLNVSTKEYVNTAKVNNIFTNEDKCEVTATVSVGTTISSSSPLNEGDTLTISATLTITASCETIDQVIADTIEVLEEALGTP